MMVTVEEIHGAIFPPGSPREGRWVLVLQAFFDESGTDRRDKALVLAGFMSPVEDWDAFAVRWQALMDEWQIPFFHMTDFMSRTGHYEKWNDELCEKRLDQLLDLICKYAKASVSISIREDRFRQVYGSKAKNNLRFALGGVALFSQMSKFARDGQLLEFYDRSADRFAFFFESGARGIGHIRKVFDRYNNQPLQRMFFRLTTFAFGAKEEYKPLQAADILAHELYWSVENEPEGLSTRHALIELHSIPHFWSSVSVADMEIWKPDILEAESRGIL